MITGDCRYIDVIGESEYLETVQTFIVELTLSVTSSLKESVLKELDELKTRCLTHLISAGLSKQEIKEGGKKSFLQTHRRNEYRHSMHKLMIHCEDFERISNALESVEQIAQGEQESVTIYMKQPVFQADVKIVSTAQNSAIDHAIEKAQNLAKRSNVKLAEIIRIQELVSAKRDSGIMGDEDWGGDSDRFAGAGFYHIGSSAQGSDTNDFDSSGRTVWIRYRVRFRIE